MLFKTKPAASTLSFDVKSIVDIDFGVDITRFPAQIFKLIAGYTKVCTIFYPGITINNHISPKLQVWVKKGQ